MPSTTPTSALSFVFNTAALFAPTGQPSLVSFQALGPLTVIDAEVGISTQSILGSLSVDATLHETHSYQNQISEHPVEQGMDVTDYVRVRPSSLTIEGVITDTPAQNALLGAAVAGAAGMLAGIPGQTGQIVGGVLAGAAVGGAFAMAALSGGFSQPSRSQGAYNQLVRLSQSQALVTVSTPFKAWSNMAFETLTVDRDSGTGAALSFHATLKEILIVTTALYDASLPLAGPANLGQKASAAAGMGFQMGTGDATDYTLVNNATGGNLSSLQGSAAIINSPGTIPTQIANANVIAPPRPAK